MTPFEWTSTGLGLVAAIGLPMLALIIRLTIRFTTMSDRLGDLTDREERRDAEIRADMREYRAATDRRLRWLEEHLWKPPPRRGM